MFVCGLMLLSWIICLCQRWDQLELKCFLLLHSFLTHCCWCFCRWKHLVHFNENLLLHYVKEIQRKKTHLNVILEKHGKANKNIMIWFSFKVLNNIFQMYPIKSSSNLHWNLNYNYFFIIAMVIIRAIAQFQLLHLFVIVAKYKKRLLFWPTNCYK